MRYYAQIIDLEVGDGVRAFYSDTGRLGIEEHSHDGEANAIVRRIEAFGESNIIRLKVHVPHADPRFTDTTWIMLPDGRDVTIYREEAPRVTP